MPQLKASHSNNLNRQKHDRPNRRPKRHGQQPALRSPAIAHRFLPTMAERSPRHRQMVRPPSRQPGTFATVQKLMAHRALIGAFSQANPLHFHAADGTGYQFLADQIIALNTLNPQVASRMVGALTSWRRFDDSRRALMTTQLERIVNTENISKDVYEVASKSLA